MPDVAKERREASRKAKKEARPVLVLRHKDGKSLGTVTSSKRDAKRAERERLTALSGKPLSPRQVKREKLAPLREAKKRLRLGVGSPSHEGEKE